MKQRFEQLGKQPELYPAVEHTHKDQGVIIVRILGQQNLQKAFYSKK